MTSSATAALRARVLPAALAADAATMPLHWIYGVGSVRTALAAHPDADVAFFPKLSCPFYSSETHPGHYAKVGDPSPYGEEAMALVEYVAVAGKGEFASAEGWADALDAWARAPGGGRLNGCSVQFLKNRDAKAPHPQGADDPQMNGTVKAVVLAAKYGGRGDAAKLASVVEQAVRVHQNNQKAVDAGVTAALVIDALLSGAAKTPLEAATHAPAHTPDSMRPWFDLAARVAKDEGRASIADPDRLFERVIKHLRTLPTFDADLAHLMTFMKEESRALGGMASSCGVPNAMGVCLLIAVASDSYEDAIRLNARFGGDNCSRAMFLGALFAAAGSPVPSDWLAKTSLLLADRVEAKWVAEIGRA